MSEVFSISEAARELGVAVDTVRTWADVGKLRAQKTLGGVRIFSREVIERAKRERRSAQGKGDEAA